MQATPVFVNALPNRPLVFRVEVSVFVDANPCESQTCGMQTAQPAMQDAPDPIGRDVSAWENEQRRKGRKDITRTKADLERIIAGCDWRALEDADARSFLDYLGRQREAGMSARTANKLVSVLSTFLEAIRVREIGQARPRVLVNWAKGLPRCEVDDAGEGSRAMTWGEFQALRDSMQERAAAAPERTARRLWYRRAAYTLLGYTGLREGMAKALELDHLHSDPDRLEVNRRTRTKRVGVVPIHRDLAGVVRELAAKTERWLFPPGTWPNFKTLIADAKEAGIPVENLGFHSFRKCFAGRCAEMGVDLRVTQKVLGHSTPALTASIYTQYEKKTLAAQLHAISGDTEDLSGRREDFSAKTLASGQEIDDTVGVTFDRPSMHTTAHSMSIGTRDAYAPGRDTLSRKAPGADARTVTKTPGKCDPHADDSSRRKPPVGLEPTTCGLQNPASSGSPSARFARLEDVADMLNAIARVLKGDPHVADHSERTPGRNRHDARVDRREDRSGPRGAANR